MFCLQIYINYRLKINPNKSVIIEKNMRAFLIAQDSISVAK